jgi:hypothetical protein
VDQQFKNTRQSISLRGPLPISEDLQARSIEAKFRPTREERARIISEDRRQQLICPFISIQVNDVHISITYIL